MKSRTSFFLVLSCLLCGCSTLPTAEEQHAQLQARLLPVVVEDGINEQEAKIIADAYLDEHMAASFGHVGPYDGGNAWIFKITGDIAPVVLTNVPPVLVNKSTGVVTWDEKPPWKR